MKKPQWITILIGVILTITIFVFGKTIPDKKAITVAEQHTSSDGHQHDAIAAVSIDSILTISKKQLSTEQVTRLAMLENSITRGAVKDQQLKVYHQLSHFWMDSMGYIYPYAWYLAEAARLENSEKTLTFAARLFLDNLQQEENPGLRQWGALQAKDLFERSLKINPGNDSSKTGLGATYLFGGVSDNPMQGIAMIREVVERDSTNLYAQLTLAKGSILSGQVDKAEARLLTVNRLEPKNLDAILLLAEVHERKGEKIIASEWYKKSLPYLPQENMRAEVEKRIVELQK